MESRDSPGIRITQQTRADFLMPFRLIWACADLPGLNFNIA